MVTIRRVIEEEINEEGIGEFLAEQSRTIPVRGCFIIPAEGEATFEPVPIRRGDFIHLREQEYRVQGIHPNSPIYVAAVVPEAGVFWGLYLRDAEKSIGGSFFNGAQAVRKPRSNPVRLATERPLTHPVAQQIEG